MSNVTILKDRIDSGRTADKVAFPDPAMAPLGTDEEAGGNPTSPQIIEHTINNETVRDRPKESFAGFKVHVAIILAIVATFVVAAYLLI